ncbi:MAG: YihY family inner membrane protein [bacterium]|nr:YihY family inner membrane protein [bacterium]
MNKDKTNYFKHLKTELQKLRTLNKTELWGYNLKNISTAYRPVLFLYRIFYFIFIDFAQKKTLMVACALSYATVLGIIPIMLVVISLSKGFLEQNLPLYTPKIVDFLIYRIVPVFHDLHTGKAGANLYLSLQNYINNQLIPTLMNMNFHEIGLYGAIVLIVISVSLMRTIEKAFNDIWGVQFKRAIWKMVLNYWLIMALFPAIILILLWITGFSIFKDVMNLRQSIWFARIFTDQASTFIIIWVLFTVLYKIIPNTKVRLFPAIIGGVIGGSLWQINNMLSFLFVSNAIRTHYLYGSVGIIPILLIALFVGWLIVLFGAHVAYAIQNLEFFRAQILSSDIQPSDQQEIAVVCLVIIAEKFINEEPPPTVSEISNISGLPTTYLANTLVLLKNAGYVNTTSDEPPKCILAIPPEHIHLKNIMEKAIGHKNDKTLPFVSNKHMWQDILNMCNDYRNSFTEEANPPLSKIIKTIRF